MKAQIVTIGDEILIGQIVDTNSTYIAKQLNSIGIEVSHIHSISDTEEAIIETLSLAQDCVDLVLITGGLGPTKDDITKHTLCKYFNDHLENNLEVLAHIETLFEKYIDLPINDLNRAQALLPSKATYIKNSYGTAVGMWMKKNKTVFISMPGVPYEMKNMMEHFILPKLQSEFDRPVIVHKTMMTYGWGESVIAEKIKDWENNLPPHIKLAYLPNLGRVRLRLTAKGSSKKQLENQVISLFDQLYPLIGEIITGFESDQLIEAQIGDLLKSKGLSFSTAESCTGGRIAALISSISGSSAYFKGSIIAYDTQVKINQLGVSPELINAHSVVSAEVALAMARGARKALGSDVALSTTGNAGPSKGDSEAELGTVYIALITPHSEEVFPCNFGKHREKTLQKTVNKSLEVLLKCVK